MPNSFKNLRRKSRHREDQVRVPIQYDGSNFWSLPLRNVKTRGAIVVCTRTKTRKSKKTSVSGFVHILKPCLLQKEPFHCWAPPLVFRKTREVPTDKWSVAVLICCKMFHHHHIVPFTRYTLILLSSLHSHYSGPPLGGQLLKTA